MSRGGSTPTKFLVRQDWPNFVLRYDKLYVNYCLTAKHNHSYMIRTGIIQQL